MVGPLRARRHALPRGHRQGAGGGDAALRRGQDGLGGEALQGQVPARLPDRDRHLPQGAALRAAAVGGAAAADAARAHVAAEGDRAADGADLQAVGRSHAVSAQGSVQGSVAAEVLAGDRPAGQTPLAGDCRHGGDPGRRLWRLRVPALADRGWGGRPCRAVQHRGRRGPTQGGRGGSQRKAALDTERQREKEATDARQRQIEQEQRRKELAEAQRQAELAEARRRKEQADAAEADARRKAEAEAEEKRIAAQEDARRKADAAEKRRIAALEDTRRAEEAEAERKRREEQRIAALEEASRSEDRRKEDERLRLAAIPNDTQRAEFVRKMQEILKRHRCYEGAVNGKSDDTQDGLKRFVDTASSKGSSVKRIELAKAAVGDFESWLKDADAIKGSLCAPPPKPKPEPEAKPRKQQQQQPVVRRQEAPPRQYSAPRPAYSAPRSGGGMGQIQGIQ